MFKDYMFTLIVMMSLQFELSQSSSKSKVNIPTGINTCNNRDYDLTDVVNLTAVNLDTRTLIG